MRRQIKKKERVSEIDLSDAKYNPLSRVEEHELISRYKETGDTDARNRVVLSYARYVKEMADTMARNYGSPRLSSDLFQEGILFLMKAVDFYDHTKYNCSILASSKKGLWIRLFEKLNKNHFVVSPPRKRASKKAKRVVQYSLDFQNFDESLDVPDFVRNMSTSLPNPREHSEIEDMARLPEIVDGVLDQIPFSRKHHDRDKDMFRYRWGLNGYNGETHTFEEIGEKYGIAKQRAHRIIVKAEKGVKKKLSGISD